MVPAMGDQRLKPAGVREATDRTERAPSPPGSEDEKNPTASKRVQVLEPRDRVGAGGGVVAKAGDGGSPTPDGGEADPPP